MSLKFFNTKSRQLEEFKPLHPPKVGLYSCGPTVYDYTHIGHLRTYVFVDLLKKTLRFFGYQVTHVLNITDVGHLTSDADTGEDKMEKRAKRVGKTVWELADFYTRYFFWALKKMGIEEPTLICRATDHLPEMINLIQRLESKGYTYKTSDGIYFDTAKFKNYGQLARLNFKGLREGARVKKNPEKKNATDFALWKFSYPQGRAFDKTLDDASKRRQMEWQSPWGLGFPGWHLECSAMSMKYLGETFDIHTGGVDHIPVHHTNEIAQSEAATGKPFVRYWLHAGHLKIEGKKMSKSLGNFYRVEDLEKKGFYPLALRYLFLTAHYRSALDLRWEALTASQKAWEKLGEFIRESRQMKKEKISRRQQAKLADFQRRFKEKLGSDLDFPAVLALVWQLLKSQLPPVEKRDLLLGWDKVLGLDLGRFLRLVSVPSPSKEIRELLKQREVLRKRKEWVKADEIRQKIEAQGYLLEDTPQGIRLKVKRMSPKVASKLKG